MNFSVVLIAKNEAETLPRLLGSLKEFQERGGEIVLVDTGSTDGTPNVARILGCKVTEVGERFIRTITKKEAEEINREFIWEGETACVKAGDKLFDYSAARNYAAGLASNDMVAMPDCDEVYTKLDLDAINAIIAAGVEQLEYNFVFSHDQYGNEAIKFLHSKFYNRKKMQWRKIIHEVLTGSANRQFLDEKVIKLEHYQNPTQNRGHYLKGLALDCYYDKTDDRNLHYFGRELLWTGRPRSAIKQFLRHLELSKWTPERSQSMVFIGDAHLMLGEEKAAIQWWHSAFTEDGLRREPLMRLAWHYYQKQDPQKAACYAMAALQIPWSNFYANLRDHYENLPHEILYWALYQLDRKEEAKKHFDIALAYRPQNSQYLHDYRVQHPLPKVSFIIPTLGREKGLKRCLDSIKNLNYPQELIETIVLDGAGTVPAKVKQGVEKATGEWLVYAANDVEFMPDSLMSAYLVALVSGKRLIAFNTGDVLPDEGNINEHFMIRRDLVPVLGGEIFDTEFHHVGVDNLLWAKAKRLDECLRAEEAVVKHYHFARTNAPMDEVYQLAWSKVEEDRALLKRKLAEIK